MQEKGRKDFVLEGLDHIGIVPSEDDGLLILLKDFLGLSCSEKEEILDQKTVVRKLDIQKKIETSETTQIELLEPLNREGVIEKYRMKNKSGIHHIALRVSGIESAISFLKSKKIEMIDHKPRIGHNGCKVAFIHPRSTSGILCELVEKVS